VLRGGDDSVTVNLILLFITIIRNYMFYIILLLSLCSLIRVKNVDDSFNSAELVGKSFFAYF